MTDRISELEEQVERLKTALREQFTAKDQAYDELAELGRHADDLAQQNTALYAELARAAAHATATGLEADLYRDRYNQALTRIAAAGRAITIANVARDYLAAIERRGSLEDDVIVHLERLREEVGFSLDADVNPLHVMIIERDDELETLRRRSAELRDEISFVTAQLEDSQGHASDWQELAEVNDRKLVGAQQKLRHLDVWSAEVNDALTHIAECQDGCDACRRVASDTIDSWSTTNGH